MTTESVARLSRGDTIPESNINRHDKKSRGDDKRVLRLRGILGMMHAEATGRQGLPAIDRDIDEFNLDTVIPPGRHIPGNIQVALFRETLWLAATTGGLPEHEHRLRLAGDGSDPIYHRRAINIDAEDDKVKRIVGYEDIADAADEIESDMGQLLYALQIEKRDRWQRRLSDATLRYAYTGRISA